MDKNGVYAIGQAWKTLSELPANIVIYRVADDGERISLQRLHWTDSLPKMLGYTAEEFKEKNRDANAMNDVFATDRPYLWDKIRQCVERRQDQDFSYRLLQCDGEFLWVHTIFHFVRDFQGEPALISNISHTELAESQFDLVNRVPGGVGIYIIRGKLPERVFLNDGYFRMMGVTREEREKYTGQDTIKAIHPEDRSIVLNSMAEAVTEDGYVQCVVRMMLDSGDFHWLQLTGQIVDRKDGSQLFYVTFALIDTQMKVMDAYRNHLATVMQLNPNAISTFRMNLTRDTVSDGASPYWNIFKLQKSGRMTGFFRDAEPLIPNEGERRIFRRTFDRKNLLAGFEQGNVRVDLKHRYLLKTELTKWVTTSLDMMRNPLNGEVEAIMYTNDVNRETVEQQIVQEALRRDYEAAGIVDTRNGEFYYFYPREHINCTHERDFFTKGIDMILKGVSEDEQIALREQLIRENILEGLRGGRDYTVVIQRVISDKSLHRYQVVFSYIDSDEELMMVAVRDFTDEILLQKLRYDSRHDGLTGLYNRSMTFAATQAMLAAHPDQTFVMCHFDIKRFRLFNSFFGEVQGDRLLYYLGRVIAKLAGEYPFAVYGRIDADVFCMVVPWDEERFKTHCHILEDSLAVCRKDFIMEGYMGYYTIVDRAMDPERMFSRATIAAKEGRRGTLANAAHFDDAMERQLQAEQQIVSDMRRAIEEEQFLVYLQPKYRLSDGSPCGAEALVRWQHPERGFVMPGTFIPLFEGNGFITELDRYMWEHCCRLLRKWLDAGLDPDPISVNVSRVSMYSPETVEILGNLISLYRLPPRLLNLELTESAYMDNPREMKERLLRLQQMGFIIMMDDFGSGYSSLNMLKELPVDYLKVDMRFLSDDADMKRSRMILASVIHMAHWLDLPVIMEGVETETQKAFLKAIGCTYAQGFLFARPMPVADYEARVVSLGRAGRPADRAAGKTGPVLASIGGDDARLEMNWLPAAVTEELETLRRMVYADSLTGVGNRRFFGDMRYVDKKAIARGGLKLAFIMLDLVNFKEINDTWGHAAGDKALIRLAGALKDAVGDGGSVIRLGGDEFLVVLSGCEKEALAGEIQRLEAVVSGIHYGPGKDECLAASFGTAWNGDFDADSQTAEAMLEAAEAAMYAKTRG